MELKEISQTAKDRLQEIGVADAVLGCFEADTPERVSRVAGIVRESMNSLARPARVILLHNAAGFEFSDQGDDRFRAVAYPLQEPGAPVDPVQAVFRGYRTAIGVSADMGARACATVWGDPQMLTPQWIYCLIRPVLELDFDLVAPCYDHQKFEALLTSSMVAPFERALYGKRIPHPLGPDFGFSGRFAAHLGSGAANISGPFGEWMFPLSEAVRGSFEICRAHVGVRRYPPADWSNLSAAMVQVLAPIFHKGEQTAAFWQRVRGSKPVPVFGEPTFLSDSAEPIDVTRLFESYQLGCRNLTEVWSMVLPPTTMLELKKLSLVPLERFCMPDALWARTVYDFALGFHLKTINQDHLLRSMTPLYLGWVASYAREIANSGPLAIEERLERLALAFENTKAYFVSRWRWPDRFNP